MCGGVVFAVEDLNPIYKIPSFFVPKEGIIVETSGRCKMSSGNLFNLQRITIGDKVVDNTRLLLSTGCSILIHFSYDFILEVPSVEKEYDFVLRVEGT